MASPLSTSSARTASRSRRRSTSSRRISVWAHTEVTTATSAKKVAETKLDDFCVSQAKIIKGVLTTGNSAAYNNYHKRKFKQAAEALTVQAAVAATLTEEQKAPLRSQKDGQPKPAIERVSAPSIDLAALTQEVEALVSGSVVAQTLDELKADRSLAAWVQTGLTLHSGEQASDTCRFCRGPLEAVRRLALEAHFNDAFAAFQRDLSRLLSRLKTAKQSVGSVPLPGASRFYDVLVSEVSNAVAPVSVALSATDTALDALIALVEAKRDNPFAPTAAAATSPQSPASVGDAVAALNAIVDRHNQTSSQFKASVNEACDKLEASYIAEAHAEFLQLAEAVATANTALDYLKDKPARIQKEIHALESQILEHQRPANELTKELCEYLGRDELRFEVKGTGYALTRTGQPVSHLSEGERTAIAFLYFLKKLQDKTFDLKNGIVVIDDPVSSLDANALFSGLQLHEETEPASPASSSYLRIASRSSVR